MKTIKLYMLFRLNIVTCVVLIPHYNGLLRSPSTSRLNQSLIKSNWKWHIFIENQFQYLIKINFHTLLISQIRKESANTANLGVRLHGYSFYGNITSKHSQFYYWHSLVIFTMKWWHKNHFIKIFWPLNAVGIQ